MKPKVLHVGDWVRFMHGGVLVIDHVDYIVPRSDYDSTKQAMTAQHGQIDFDDALEIRRPSRPEEGKTPA